MEIKRRPRLKSKQMSGGTLDHIREMPRCIEEAVQLIGILILSRSTSTQPSDCGDQKCTYLKILDK